MLRTEFLTSAFDGTGTSLIDQQIYISSPITKLLYYSNNRIENINLTNELSLKEISPEFFVEFKKHR